VTKTSIFILLGACALGVLLHKLHLRLQLSRARQRSLTGHARMARRFARLVPFYEYGDAKFFRVDAAPDDVATARRSRLVRFCGAYHGWWGDVQPGVGNPLPARDTYTLKDMDDTSLRVLRSRRDIACVLVNPLQALLPACERRKTVKKSFRAVKKSCLRVHVFVTASCHRGAA
jgi:hypothetical protein